MTYRFIVWYYRIGTHFSCPFYVSISNWQIWSQKHCLRPQIMLMRRQHFVSLQTMQLTGSTGAGLQLVDRRHLMVSLSTFVVSLRFILWIICADIYCTDNISLVLTGWKCFVFLIWKFFFAFSVKKKIFSTCLVWESEGISHRLLSDRETYFLDSIFLKLDIQHSCCWNTN